MTATRLDAVDAALDDFFSASRSRAESLGDTFVELWRALERTATSGEARRAHAAAAAYKALGGTDRAACASVGAALELLYAALTVHGDVIDRGLGGGSSRGSGRSTRATGEEDGDDGGSKSDGDPSLFASFHDEAVAARISRSRADLRGTAAAIIAGDLALAGASRILLATDCAPETRQQLLDLFDEVVFVSSGAKLVDVELGLDGDSLSPAVAFERKRVQDARLSVTLPLRAGAILAGAPRGPRSDGSSRHSG